MKLRSFTRFFGNLWRGGPRRQARRRVHRPVPARLFLESLEDRTLMSVLPAGLVNNQAFLNTSATTAGRGPQIIIDPLNPNKLVEVHTTTSPANVGSLTVLAGNYSIDGGHTWNPLFTNPTGNSVYFLDNLADPGLVNFSRTTSFSNTYPNYSFRETTEVSIAFDRTESFYIVDSEHNTANPQTSGAIVLQKFDFSTATPTQTITNEVLYQWFNQDPAYNPVVAVDTNEPTFTDPQTGVVQTDTLATLVDPTGTGNGPLYPKAVYVSWNVIAREPNNTFAASPTFSQVVAMASADGGQTWTTQQDVSPYLRSGNAANNNTSQASAPQIVFTQQSTDGLVPGGQLTFLWNNLSTSSAPFTNPPGPGPAVAGIVIDKSLPDGGVAANPAAAAEVFVGSTGQITDPAIGNPDVLPPNPDMFTASVDITDPNFDVLADLDVTLSIEHPHLNQLSIVLRAPDNRTVTLLNNRMNSAGQTPNNPPGVADQNSQNTGLGYLNGNYFGNSLAFLATDENNAVSTVFDQNAHRNITDATGSAPYVSHFRPESGSLNFGGLSIFNGLPASALKGVWTLEVRDFRNDRLGAGGNQPNFNQFVHYFALNFTSRISTTGFGTTAAGTEKIVPGAHAVPASATNTYSVLTAAAGTPGIGPGVVAAVDNSLGSFSPFQGRIYIAYTSYGSVTADPTTGFTALGGNTNTDVKLIYSDNNGLTWSTPVTMNDDSPLDNFSEGRRQQFTPQIAVDPTTGTLVTTYFDARYDAANARVATSLSASIDGGATFSKSVYLNTPKTATDAITGRQIAIEPIPGNQAQAGALGFGDHQGLAVYGGKVFPLFAGNLNAAGANLLTATVTVAAGPRVVSGDMGPVNVDFITDGGFAYNNSFASDGTRQLNGFVITFDRPVDPTTFDKTDVSLQYRSPTTPAGSPPTDISNQVVSVTPLDLSTSHGATDFGTAPTLSVSDYLVREGNSGSQLATFTVILSQVQPNPVTVNYATADGTAVAGVKYTAASGTVTIPVGQTSATFTVPVLGNTTPEADTYFFVNLSNAPAGFLLAKPQGKGTIVDNDGAPTLTVGNAMIKEGDSGTGLMSFPVYLSAPSAQAVSVQYATADGTATVAGSDYLAKSGTLNIAAGATTGSIDITVKGDQLFEGNEFFVVNLTNPVGVGLARLQATGVVVDDDALGVTIGDVTVQEGNPGPATTASVPVFLNAATSKDVTINYTVTPGTATSGNDYTASPATGSVVITAGTTSNTISIPIVGNTVAEPNETFTVTINSVTNASVIRGASTVTIIDDDQLPVVSMGDAIVREGNTGTTTASVPIYLSYAVPTPVTVTYKTSAGPGGSVSATDQTGPNPDYTGTPAAGTTFVIPADTLQTTINIPINGDLAQESNEVFTVSLISPTTGATVAPNKASGTVTIVDDDVHISVSNVFVQEGNPPATPQATFTLFLDSPSASTVTVTVSTSNGSASSGIDYVPIVSQVVTFNPGQTTQNVSVQINANTFADGNRTFFLNLSNPTNATISPTFGTGTGTIVDDDDTSVLNWTIGDAMRQEGQFGQANLVFPVFLSTPSGSTETINYTTIAGSASDSTNDYVFTSSPPVLTMAPGQTVSSIVVPIKGDVFAEGDENFFVRLSNPSSGGFLRQQGTGVILDDDRQSLNVGHGAVREGNNGFTTLTFPVVLSNPSPGPVNVQYTTADNTATAPADYNAVAFGNLNIPANSLTGSINVAVRGDTLTEGNENFFLNLGLVGGNLQVNGPLSAFPQATGTIVDDDNLTVSVGDVAVQEGTGGSNTAPVTFYLNGVSSRDVLVNYSTQDGSAVDGVDYTGGAGSTTITAGTTSKTVGIPINPDALANGNRDFFVNITGLSNAGLGRSQGSVLIVDDDLKPALTVSDTIQLEGDSSTANSPVTVFSSFSVSQPITFQVTTTDNQTSAGDYTHLSGQTQTIAANTTSVTFNVTIQGDTLKEGNETYNLLLSNAQQGGNPGPTFARSQGLGTIVDDDNAPSLSVSDILVKEDDTGMKTVYFTLLLSQTLPAGSPPVTVDYATADGTATAGTDYVATSGTATIAVPPNGNGGGAVIGVVIKGDSIKEGNFETFFLNLSNPIGATIAKPQGVVTIVDDDSAFGATQFLVKINPQTATGTYSYAIGPNVRDRIRINPPGPVTTYTPTAAEQNKTIPAAADSSTPSVTTSTIAVSGVPAGKVVGDVTVKLTINHPRPSDLKIELVSSNNTTVLLSNFEPTSGASGSDFVNTTFDDAAAQPISAGTPPFTGTFRPETPLSAIDGSDPNGTWTLRVTSRDTNDTGTLVTWSLNVKIITPVIDPVPGTGGTYTPPGAQQNKNIPIATATPSVTTSTLTVSGVPAGQVVRDLTVKLSINHPNPANLVLELVSPNGPTVLLSNFEPTDPNDTGDNFLNTVFDDQGLTPISAGVTPFTGTFRPETPLADVVGTAPNGTWTLRVTSYDTANIGKLVGWSLRLQTGTPATVSLGNYMDQNQNAVTADKVRDPGDIFSIPRPLSGTPFQLPYDPDTLPLILTGAHVVNRQYDAGTSLNPIDLAIPDAVSQFGVTTTTPVTSTLTISDVPAGRLLNDMRVFVDIRHGKASDLRLTLIAPDGTEVLLSNQNGGIFGGADYFNTTFDDGAQVSITSFAAFPPFHGSFQPEEALRKLVGKNPNGTWTLKVEDFTPGNAGRLLRWSLLPDTSLVRNGTTNFVDVVFDRDIKSINNGNPNTFTAGDILQMTGPAGNITGPFTVTANPAGTDPALANRTFRIGFPTQTLSGSYSLVLSPFSVVGSPPSRLYIQSLDGNSLDNNLNAGLEVLRGVDPSNPTVSLVTAGSTQVPVTIGANQTVTAALTITDNFVIQQTAAQHIQALLNITNTVRDVDLEARLTAPDGTVVRLFTAVGQFGSGAQGFNNTTFDDFAAAPIQTGPRPFNVGAFNPETPLSVLNGKNAQGTWTLSITNNGTATGQLTSFQLKLPKGQTTSGLGEDIADRFQAHFRIFTQDPTNVQSSTTWTAVGPAAENSGKVSGRVGGVAVDPSDSSGNTVFVSGASGGVWKTTNFLTADPGGPNWVPLTDFGPTLSLNTGSIAVFGRNSDPNQSIVFIGTGEGDTQTTGVGLLRSMDGGKTWQVITGSVNFDSNHNPLPMDPLKLVNGAANPRTRQFFGTEVFKVIVDPNVRIDGNVNVYIAVTDRVGNNGGIWRSIDTGETWTKLQLKDQNGATIAGTTNATDVVLAQGSAGANGNLQLLYAGVANQGVFFTSSAATTSSLNLVDGGVGVNRNDADVANGTRQVPVNNPPSTPTGASSRIVLATPAKTNNPLQDKFYQGWLYAAVITPGGSLAGLYLTKDSGNNWTRVRIPVAGNAAFSFPTNDDTKADYDVTTHGAGINASSNGDYAIALAIDPTDPNVVYLGGSHNSAPSYALDLIRVDSTTINDPYAMVAFDNSDNDGGLVQTGPAGTDGAVSTKGGSASYGVLDSNDLTLPARPAYYNLAVDPDHPFFNPSSLQLHNVFDFNNDGTDTKWNPIDANLLLDSTNMHEMLAVTDPLTGRTRLLVGNDNGIFTGVDKGENQLQTSVGSAQLVSGGRNGNLQISLFYSGTSQPSTLAADLAGALFYGMASGSGFPVSANDILQTGNLNWNSPILGDGAFVGTDPTGSGTVYQYVWPTALLNNALPPLTPDSFFLVTTPGSPPQSSVGTSKSLFVAANDRPTAGASSEWTGPGGSLLIGFNFAINPADPDALVISSRVGRVFRKTGASIGTNADWTVIGQPGNLDGTNANALAFGAPDPASPGVLDDFIYAGTKGGRIFVTFDGGGTWKNISTGLDNSAVQVISTNPARGSHEAYAVTQRGVYWMADSSVAAPAWVQINGTTIAAGGTKSSGNLFELQRPVFGPGANATTAADTFDTLVTNNSLTSLAADWRFAIPDNLANPSGPKHPVLYVAGEAGVYRSRDKGVHWTYYPNQTAPDGLGLAGSNGDGSPDEGGYLPNVKVTHLDLALGNVNKTTGNPDTSAGLNLLVATTFGRGTFAIRTDNSEIAQYLVIPNFGPKVTAVAPISPVPGTTMTGMKVTFSGAIDPQTFSVADIVQLTDPDGVAITPTAVKDITADELNLTANQANPHNIYAITFAAQTKTGTAAKPYRLKFGPNLTDMGGNLMDQNGNGINGQPGFPPSGDGFSGTILFTPNTPPKIGAAGNVNNPIPDQSTPPGSSGVVVPFMVADTETPVGSLVVTGTSSDQNLVLNTSLVFGGSGANRTVTITPEAGAHGVTTITLTVTDGGGATASRSFVLAVNNAPVVSNPGNMTVNHSPTSKVITFTATDADGDPLTFPAPIISVVSGPPATPAPTATNVTLVSGSTYTFTLNWANSFAGVFDVTFGANDGFQTTNVTFRMTVVNTAPVLSNLGRSPNTTHNGPVTVSFNATDAEDPLTAPGSFPTPQLMQYTQAFSLKTSLGLFAIDPASFNYGGQNEKWLKGAKNQFNQIWYFIKPNTAAQDDNELWAWDGQSNKATGALLATLVDPNIYPDPQTWLLNIVQSDPAPSASVTVSAVSSTGGTGYQFTINGLNTYAGIGQVRVKVTDGVVTTSRDIAFTVTNAAPVVNLGYQSNQSHTATGGMKTITFTASDADGDTMSLNPAPQVQRYTQATDLDAQYGLIRSPSDSANNYYAPNPNDPKWIQGTVIIPGSSLIPWYYIKNDGTFWQWGANGQGKDLQGKNAAPDVQKATLEDGANIYLDPSLLWNPQAQPTPPASVTVSNITFSGGAGSFRLNGLNNFVGILRVVVPVTDGRVTTTKAVAVTLTNAAPVVTMSSPPAQSHRASNTMTLNFTASDADSDPMSLNPAPRVERFDQTQPDPAGKVTVSGFTFSGGAGTVTLSGLNNFVGTFNVVVSVTDGFTTTIKKVAVTLTNAAPTLSVTSVSQGSTPVPPDSSGNYTVSSSGGNTLTVRFNASDADNDPLTPSAQVQPFDFPQQLFLDFDTSYYQNFYGQNEKWLRSYSGRDANGFGTGAKRNWFALVPKGNVAELHALSNNGIDPAVIATFPISFWQDSDPARFFRSADLNNPGSKISVSAISGSQPNYTFTLSGLTNYRGIFKVVITVSDGFTSKTVSFLVTVN